MGFASEQLLNRKDIVENNFLISVKYSFNVIKIAAMRYKDSCIYLYGRVSLLAPECAVCVCVCVCLCGIKSEYQQKTTLCVKPQLTWHLVA